MGAACLSACTECQRHVRCGERVCPFCGARVTSHLRALEYRLKNQLSRGRAFSLGAALAAAGFAMSCDDESVAPPYGLACFSMCGPSTAGTAMGGAGGQSGAPPAGGVAGAAAAGSGSSGVGGPASGGGLGGVPDPNGGAGGERAIAGAAGSGPDAAGAGGQGGENGEGGSGG
jgi:hypothetical protein